MVCFILFDDCVVSVPLCAQNKQVSPLLIDRFCFRKHSASHIYLCGLVTVFAWGRFSEMEFLSQRTCARRKKSEKLCQIVMPRMYVYLSSFKISVNHQLP
jgi:hypothetical protein